MDECWDNYKHINASVTTAETPATDTLARNRSRALAQVYSPQKTCPPRFENAPGSKERVGGSLT